ncbi:MAG TPA: hypothetical protein VF282_05585 [Bacillota bacterium]
MRPMAAGRFPLAVVAALALLAAIWAGLARMGWQLPAVLPDLPAHHGDLMISGFLGTVISLERAAALKMRWTLIVPALAGIGSFALLSTAPAFLGLLLVAAASSGLVWIYVTIYRIQPALHTAVMAGGAGMWLVGNLLRLAGSPVSIAIPWWAGFLVLTIVGERIELTRLRAPTPARRATLLAAVAVFTAGLVLSLFRPDLGVRVAGAGLAAQGVWLATSDIARRTIRQPGLTRFIAWTLLAGYGWLVAAGVLWLALGYQVAGAWYDAMLHAVFLGFVMSMIFGHAPIILPSVLGVQMAFSRAFYAHLILLHVSLVVRLAGDLLLKPGIARWGGLLNAVALVLFGFNTIRAVRAARR